MNYWILRTASALWFDLANEEIDFSANDEFEFSREKRRK